MLAWAPTTCGAPTGCSRGYTERHVYRVACCPNYQFQRGYNWQSRPVAVRAISEELLQRGHEENVPINGASLDHLASVCPQHQASDTTLVHAGERQGRPRVSDSLTTPVVQTATFTFRHASAGTLRTVPDS